MAARHLPNLLTALRIGLTPFLYGSIADGSPRQALLLFALAALSDGLDGFLARRYGWTSRLGGLLDPIADKLLLNACFLGLWVGGLVPGWLVLLVFGRDVIIIAGALAYHRFIRELQPEPSLLGKANTAVQIGFVLLMLVQAAFSPLPSQLEPIGVWIVAAAALASGADYVQRWGRRAWGQRRDG